MATYSTSISSSRHWSISGHASPAAYAQNAKPSKPGSPTPVDAVRIAFSSPGLFDFDVDELHQRQPEDPSLIRPIPPALPTQRDALLASAAVLDEKLRPTAHA